MKYQLLALDIDGTLVNPDQTVPSQTIQAIEEAQQAGMQVCLATGRSYIESMPVWRQLRLQSPYAPMVLIGGALVSEPDTGRTLYQRTIPQADAVEYAETLCREGYSAMTIVDPWRTGVDYYLLAGKDVESADRMWFSKMNVKIVRLARMQDVPDMPALRVNAVAPPDQAPRLAAMLAERFAGRLNIHSILAPNYGVTVVEAFAPDVSKWTALMYVAQAWRIGPGRIIAVGDDVNDLPMIRSAGLGVAMSWAAGPVKAVAKRLAEPDLAQFIRQVICEV